MGAKVDSALGIKTTPGAANVEPAIDANFWNPEGEGENEEAEEAADTPAAGSGSRPSSASSGAVEAESTVAGSGNPASSVSSGRVEAEGCGHPGSWPVKFLM